jgi:hypothetical protein
MNEIEQNLLVAKAELNLLKSLYNELVEGITAKEKVILAFEFELQEHLKEKANLEEIKNIALMESVTGCKDCDI